MIIMSAQYRINIVFVSGLLILIGMLGAGEVNGQNQKCSAGVLVTVSGTDVEVSNVKAMAVNDVTKKIYTSVLKKDMPYFASLPEGDYKITLSKPGFKHSLMQSYHDCTYFKEGVFEWSAEMY